MSRRRRGCQGPHKRAIRSGGHSGANTRRRSLVHASPSAGTGTHVRSAMTTPRRPCHWSGPRGSGIPGRDAPGDSPVFRGDSGPRWGGHCTCVLCTHRERRAPVRAPDRDARSARRLVSVRVPSEPAAKLLAESVAVRASKAKLLSIIGVSPGRRGVAPWTVHPCTVDCAVQGNGGCVWDFGAAPGRVATPLHCGMCTPRSPPGRGRLRDARPESCCAAGSFAFSPIRRLPWRGSCSAHPAMAALTPGSSAGVGS